MPNQPLLAHAVQGAAQVPRAAAQHAVSQAAPQAGHAVVRLAWSGPPPWTLGRVFTSWQFEPVVVVLAVLAAAGYGWGLARLRRAGMPWGLGRTAAFFGGLALWVCTVCSGLGVYEKVLFTDRAVQAVTLLMIVPLLLAMGAPVGMLVEASGERTAAAVRRALRGRVSTVLMFPLVSTVVLMLPPWLFYFTGWYRASLTSTGGDIAFHVCFVLFGMLYFWPRLQIDPVARSYHPLFSVLITVAEVLADAALGFTLVFGSHLLVSGYWHELARPWGMSPADDQKWGGAVLWGLGDIAGVPFLVALIVRVIREEKAKTAEVDRELDRAEAEAAAASAGARPVGAGVASPARTGSAAAEAGAVAEPGATAEAGFSRPWWETDPRFAHRYGRGSDA